MIKRQNQNKKGKAKSLPLAQKIKDRSLYETLLEKETMDGREIDSLIERFKEPQTA